MNIVNDIKSFLKISAILIVMLLGWAIYNKFDKAWEEGEKAIKVNDKVAWIEQDKLDDFNLIQSMNIEEAIKSEDEAKKAYRERLRGEVSLKEVFTINNVGKQYLMLRVDIRNDGKHSVKNLVGTAYALNKSGERELAAIKFYLPEPIKAYGSEYFTTGLYLDDSLEHKLLVNDGTSKYFVKVESFSIE